MRRRLLNLLTALSLLLCVAVAALWVRSYFVADWVMHKRFTALADHPDSDTTKRVDLHRRAWQVLTARGRLLITFSNDYLQASVNHGLYPVGGPPTFEGDWRRIPPPPLPPETPLERIGFVVRRTSAPSGFGTGVDTGLQLGFPLWLPFVLCAILPAVWARRRLRARRVGRLGLRPTCGYDLRGTPGRCPECGTIAPVAPPE
jgi:hypothetical protein